MVTTQGGLHGVVDALSLSLSLSLRNCGARGGIIYAMIFLGLEMALEPAASPKSHANSPCGWVSARGAEAGITITANII